MERDALPGLLEQQEQLQGQRLVARIVPLAAGRAGQLSRLLGASLFRPGLPRRDQSGGEGEPAASRLLAAIGLPRRHLTPPVAPGQPGWPCSTITWSAVRCVIIPGLSSSASARSVKSSWNTARPTRSKARTCSRSRGAWTLGRWAPTASFPGRPSELPTPGSRPTSSRSSTRTPPEAQSGRPGPGKTLAPIPSIRLKSYRRGQQDVEYLTLWSQLHDQPRWAVGQQGAYGAQAGRNAPGNRLHRRRRRRTDRLRPAASAASLGTAGRDRRGPLTSPPRPKTEAGRLSHAPPRPGSSAGQGDRQDR